MVTAAFILASVPLLISWAYLAILSVAALAGPRTSRETATSAHPRLTVLVPAHDEAGMVARCVHSLRRQSYPSRVIVIADNCTDSTAAQAESAGAEVMVRWDPEHPGKGRALRWAMDGVLAEANPPEGIVVVDADSVADPGLLLALSRALGAGAPAAQSDYTVLIDPQAGGGDRLRALAILLFNRTRNLGRAAMGLPAALLGNGMMLSRDVLETHPWDAFSAVEDLEFAVRCRLRGVHPQFIAGHGVRGPLPLGYRAGVGQRLRWEGGRFHVARTLGPALVAKLARRPDAAALDALLELSVPPLSILFMVTGAGQLSSLAMAVLGIAGIAAPAAWAAAVALAIVHVLIGLKAAGESFRSTAALLALPGFLAWKVGVYLRLLRGFDPNHWQRSVRNGDTEWR